MIGFLDLLQKTRLDPMQADYVRYIRTSSRHLLCVLNDILTFSKLEAGKVKLERKEFDLRGVVESAVDTIRGLADEKGTEVIVHVPRHCPATVVGDELRLMQVLTKYFLTTSHWKW